MRRKTRDSLRAKTLVRELRQRDIKVVSLNDPEIDPDTVAGVYMEAITFAKNEAYSREVAFHTRKGCRANIQTRDPEIGWCYKNGGQPLWGYRLEHLDLAQPPPAPRPPPVLYCLTRCVPSSTPPARNTSLSVDKERFAARRRVSDIALMSYFI